MFYLLLFIVVILASTLSALFGLAGGTIIMAVFTWTLGIKAAVPLHSTVQLVGNVARIGVYYALIEWKIVRYFVVLTLPGAYLGGLCINLFDEKWLEFGVGFFILLTLVLPAKKKDSETNYKNFVLLGFLSSFLGMIVAVSGPFIASFFVMNRITKEKLIATKSVCQGITQIVKLIVFVSIVHFSFEKYGGLLFWLSVAAIVGTFLGRYLINFLNEKTYNQLNNWLLFVIASAMIVVAFIKILQS
ncbi:MAG: sulfite exporter TauE/SafE family protein [Cytophagales bacterium]|nr:MAG: sulfite exporter TauE/SafE family protein [Cytophagales bacterium]